MKNKIRSVLYVLATLVVLALIPVFLSKDEPIAINLPELKLEEVEAQEHAQQKAAEAAAQRAAARRVFQCEAERPVRLFDRPRRENDHQRQLCDGIYPHARKRSNQNVSGSGTFRGARM